ncbi:hypothetical protein, partial [Sporisorium scitamineum]
VSNGMPPLSPSYLPLGSLDTYTKLWSAFVRSDRRTVPTSVASASVEPRDLSASLQVLRAASKSFNAASLLLPWDLRTDLGCLYAFCRVADDLVDDDAQGLEAKFNNLEVIRAIVDAIYADAPGQAAQKQKPVTLISERIRTLLAPVALPDKIKQDTRAAAVSIAPLTRYIPKRLWYEMLQGYSLDLLFEHPDVHKRTRLQSIDDLVEYSQCVAGVVGEMCTRVILGRCGSTVPLNLQVDRKIALQSTNVTVKEENKSGRTLDLTQREDLHALLYEARRMGVSLQLVNIARDIVPDSVELRRCYLPAEMFDKEDGCMQDALLAGRLDVSKQDSPRTTGSRPSPSEQDLVQPQDVRKYTLRLLSISKGLYDQSYPALAQIPNRPARAGLKAACSVYAAIGTRIQAQTAEEIAAGKRARMSTADRVRRAIFAVYFGI